MLISYGLSLIIGNLASQWHLFELHSLPSFLPPFFPPSLPPSSPDGEEEVLEIAVDVEELLSFASNLEDALKGVARKDVSAPPPAVILNATNLHWLLGQVGVEGWREGGREGGRE